MAGAPQRFALALLLVAGAMALPARAALVTDVADAADKDDPLDVNLDFRWRRTQRQTKITREFFDSTKNQTLNVTEIRHNRWTQVLDNTITIGLFRDLELHGNIPFAIRDEQYWGWTKVNGAWTKGTSTIENNRLNANGECFSTDCNQTKPLFPVDGRVYRGGFLEPSLGLAWAIFNDEREQKLPEKWFPHKTRTATWVLGFDYTMPIIDAADPTDPDPSRPDSSAGFGLGTGAHKFDWWMAMSKRAGIVEPFLRLHYTLPVTSAKAWDNCLNRENDPDKMVMSDQGKALCDPNGADTFWHGKTGLQYPHVGGVMIGTEFIPVEEADGLRLAIVLQMAADYVSKGRRMSELSDALKKHTFTDQYLTLDSRLTFDLRFSRYVHLVTYISLGTDTPHFITSETVGKDRYGKAGGPDNDGDGQPDKDGLVELGTTEMNPNYDPRLDQPGRRFRVTEVSIFGLSSMLSINF